MRIHPKGIAALTMLVALTAAANDKLPTLTVGGETYSNVTVTTVTATDIYFSHARGMGNAKLKNLDAQLQQRFKFDPAKAGEVEKQQAVATANFHVQVAVREAQAKRAAAEPPPPVATENGDPVVTTLHARSFRGERPPQIIVPEWLTPPPTVEGRFVLVVFWRTTGCEPCLANVPHLNGLQTRFKDKLVVIGLSNESPEEMRKLAEPQVQFSLGTDTEARTRSAVEVRGIPHALLIDPGGVVRFEGQPVYLDESGVEHLIAKYGN